MSADVDSFLGGGATGFVWRVTREDGSIVALKIAATPATALVLIEEHSVFVNFRYDFVVRSSCIRLARTLMSIGFVLFQRQGRI